MACLFTQKFNYMYVPYEKNASFSDGSSYSALLGLGHEAYLMLDWTFCVWGIFLVGS